MAEQELLPEQEWYVLVEQSSWWFSSAKATRNVLPVDRPYNQYPAIMHSAEFYKFLQIFAQGSVAPVEHCEGHPGACDAIARW